MWTSNVQIWKDEEWFRLNIDNIRPSQWNNTYLDNLSKDFFREFRHKFEWRDSFGGLTKPAMHVWQKFGEKFLDEMSFDAVRRKKN